MRTPPSDPRIGPDDFCRSCGGRRVVVDLTHDGLVTRPCIDCGGTGLSVSISPQDCYHDQA